MNNDGAQQLAVAVLLQAIHDVLKPKPLPKVRRKNAFTYQVTNHEEIRAWDSSYEWFMGDGRECVDHSLIFWCMTAGITPSKLIYRMRFLIKNPDIGRKVLCLLKKGPDKIHQLVTA